MLTIKFQSKIGRNKGELSVGLFAIAMPVYVYVRLGFTKMICFVVEREITWQLYFKLNRITEANSETQIIRIFQLENKPKRNRYILDLLKSFLKNFNPTSRNNELIVF